MDYIVSPFICRDIDLIKCQQAIAHPLDQFTVDLCAVALKVKCYHTMYRIWLG